MASEKHKDAKRYLNRIKWIDYDIQNKKAELDQLRDDLFSLQSPQLGERVQTSRNLHKMEADIVGYLDNSIARVIYNEIKELLLEKREIIKTIRLLEPAEYNVLHIVYVQGKDLAEVEKIMERSYSWVTSKHGTALANLQKILDEAKEKV